MNPKEKNALRIGITGHRKLNAQQRSKLEPVIQRAIQNIITYERSLHPEVEDVIFISPMAEGADSIFSQVAIESFQGKLHVILPFEKEEYLNDFSTDQRRNEFEALMENDQVYKTEELGSIESEDRDTLYYKVGTEVVDQCNYILAIWDELDSEKQGGTSDIVHYGLNNKKNILVINPIEHNMRIKWEYLPELNVDGVFTKTDRAGFLDDTFDGFDKRAVFFQKKYRSIWSACFNLGLLAAGLLALKVAFIVPLEVKTLITFSEMAIVLILILLIRKEKKNQYHKLYLSNRFFAERMRINNLMFSCGYEFPSMQISAIQKSIDDLEHYPELVMGSKIIHLCAYNHSPLPEKQNSIRKYIKGQKKYHSDRLDWLHSENKNNGIFVRVLFLFFFILTGYHLFHEFAEVLEKYDLGHIPVHAIPKVFNAATVFLVLLLPAIVARLEGRKLVNEWERLTTQSKNMIIFFDHVLDSIPGISDESELNTFFNSIHDNVNGENIDWELFMSNKNEIPLG